MDLHLEKKGEEETIAFHHNINNPIQGKKPVLFQSMVFWFHVDF